MKKVKIIFITVFFVFIAVIGVMTVFNKREISELEARELQVFVEPDVSSVMDGSFAKKTDTAFSDQLEARDFFVKAYYTFTFQTYNGDVAKGSDNQLFASQQDAPDYTKKEKELKAIAKEINKTADELAESDKKFIYISIPRKDAIMTGYLPDTYISSDEIYNWSMDVLKANLNENVIVIDAYDLFAESYQNGENCYYTTDHHVNFTGGMLVYNEIAQIIKEDYPQINILTRDDYNVEKVVVNGSFNRLIGQSVKSEPEELNISLKEMTFKYERKEKGNLSGKDIWGRGTTYSAAYMAGDNEETVVTTNNENCPNILVTGSSYSNLLEVLLVPNSKTMSSIDYRYNKTGKTLLEYAEETDSQYVIYIPAQSTNAHGTNSMKTHLGIIKSETQ